MQLNKPNENQPQEAKEKKKQKKTEEIIWSHFDYPLDDFHGQWNEMWKEQVFHLRG